MTSLKWFIMLFSIITLGVLAQEPDTRDATPGQRAPPGVTKWRFNIGYKIVIYYLYTPLEYEPNSRMLMIVPGTHRDSYNYLEPMIDQAEIDNVLLVSVNLEDKLDEIPKNVVKNDRYLNYPRSRGYQWGNVGTYTGENEVGYTNWTCATCHYEVEDWSFYAIEETMKVVVKQMGASRNDYKLYGFSAGGQVVARFVQFMNETNANHFVAGAPSHFTFPNNWVETDVNYPYTTTDCPAMIVSNYFYTYQHAYRRMTIMVGDKDTAKQNDNAQFQGKNRYERAQTFYSAYRRNFVKSAFTLSIMEGVSHSHKAAWTYVWNELYDTNLDPTYERKISYIVGGTFLVLLVGTILICFIREKCRDYDHEERLMGEKTNKSAKPQDVIKSSKNVSMSTIKNVGTTPVKSALMKLPKVEKGEQRIKGTVVSELLQYNSIIDLLPQSASMAIIANDGRNPLRHEDLRSQVMEFDLLQFGINSTDRIGIAVKNGPELSMLLVCCATHACAAPVNPQNTVDELVRDLGSVNAKALIVESDGVEEHLVEVAKQLNVPIIEILVSSTDAAVFSLRLSENNNVPVSPITKSDSNDGLTKKDDHCLVLHTSGTSGKKKVVPYTLNNVMVGAACIIESWELSTNDMDLNLMPLFHIGGIARNVFAPILSGGSVICTNGFDAALFWDLVDQLPVTWYFAGPTIHQMILEEGKRRAVAQNLSTSVPANKIRMIANAAGALLPAVAQDMRDSYGDCAILPGYGMTECMPISAPPVSYTLDRPGTSGIAIGPELDIFDGNGKPVEVGKVGNIVVRGPPVMIGYENNEEANASSFFEGGWFDTGDLGYFDDDRYLYITGRSKEVINRGGEIISPFEIEQVIVQHPKVHLVIAFAAPHKILSETIGIWVVPNEGETRPDLYELQQYCINKLHPSKWPQVLVFSHALPRGGGSGKPQRVRLGERLQLAEIEEDSLANQYERMFEAPNCPPPATPLSVKIPHNLVDLQQEKVNTLLAEKLGFEDGDKRSIIVKQKVREKGKTRDAFVAYFQGESSGIERLKEDLESALHMYQCPSYYMALPEMPMDNSGNIDVAKLPNPGSASGDENLFVPNSQMEASIFKVWLDILGLDNESTEEDSVASSIVSVETDFFEVGGNSLLAGKLASILRDVFNTQIAVSDIFTTKTIVDMCDLINKKQTSNAGVTDEEYQHLVDKINREAEEAASGHYISSTVRGLCGSKDKQYDRQEKQTPRSQIHILPVLAQLSPICFFYPLRRIGLWFLFAYLWVSLMGNLSPTRKVSRFWNMLFAMFFTHILGMIMMPLLGICAKWIIIGKYRAGRFKLWGGMYLRWWLVNQLHLWFGKGVFGWSNTTLRWYYRMLGANIGVGVRIDPNATISEPDLITLHDDCEISRDVVLRPFCLDSSSMVLRPIVINKKCTLCAKTVIAPGSSIPEGYNLGPLTSSYEIKDAKKENYKYCNPDGFCDAPSLPWKLLGYLIVLAVKIVAYLPAYYMLWAMSDSDWYRPYLEHIGDVLAWFTTPQRIGFYIAVRFFFSIISPFIYLAGVILVKKTIIGKFEPGSRAKKRDQKRPFEVTESASNRTLFNHWLMAKLLPDGTLGGTTGLLGKHYSYISIIYRMLGAKIGKRVYWPGSGFRIVEPDLFEVGDDVVFGSRSLIFCTDRQKAAKVVLKSRVNVADRCVILPGVTIEEGAVIGSGSLIPEGKTIPAGSLWVGSTGGSAVQLKQGNPEAKKPDGEGAQTPFGKAFYEKKAPFYVIPEFLIVLMCVIWNTFVTAYWTGPLLSCLLLTNTFLGGYDYYFGWSYVPGAASNTYEWVGIIFGTYIASYLVFSFLALLIDIGLKWIIIGRRKPGNYNWDESSYAQRWQIYLLVENIRRHTSFGGHGILDFLHGSVFLVWYYRALGCKIGKDVCIYPNGGDPMMTEPDVVTLEDRATVDDASLIGHLNSRGKFTLNTLKLGTGACMRSFSRLLSGAEMEPESTMLEHTLVFAGESVEAGTTVQGWPCKVVSRKVLPGKKQEV